MTTPNYPPYDIPPVEYGPPPPRPPRKRSRTGMLLGIIGGSLILFAVIVAGCTAMAGNAIDHAANPDHATSAATPIGGQSPAPAPSPTDTGPDRLHVGDSETISEDGAGDITLTVTSVTPTSGPVDAYSDGPAKGWFVAVHITVRGGSDLTSAFDLSSFDFYALSGSAHFDEGNGNAFEGPHGLDELAATSVNAGETASGWLVFDLPRPHGHIVYAPNLDGQPLAEWKF